MLFELTSFLIAGNVGAGLRTLTNGAAEQAPEPNGRRRKLDDDGCSLSGYSGRGGVDRDRGVERGPCL